MGPRVTIMSGVKEVVVEEEEESGSRRAARRKRADGCNTHDCSAVNRESQFTFTIRDCKLNQSRVSDYDTRHCDSSVVSRERLCWLCSCI